MRFALRPHFLLVAFLILILFNGFVANHSLAATVRLQAADQQSPRENEFTVTDPPPVERIVMFNSGLSQIVHEGKLDGNCQVNMRFSEHDVDDVLKSLVFEDQGNGAVRSVEYNPAPDTQDVAAKTLGPALTLAQTLQKYRGETVTVKTAEKTHTGDILSVENRQSADAFIETLTIVNELGFISIALNDFTSISFKDESVKEHFELAMKGLQKNRLTNSRKLTLMFDGEGERKVRFSYNVDAPIWRMTYRLDLQPGNSSVQGWAHIDNVTGVDWDNIQLDLRSGRPQSFHANVFAPVLAERTDLKLRVFDLPTDKTLVSDVSSSRAPTSGFGGFPGRVGGSRGSKESINAAIQAAGTPGRSNKTVRFALKERVSIPAGHSSMLPVMAESVPVDLYSMFDGRKPEFASLVAQISNTSETPFIPGPVSLYQAGDFVGDAAIDRVESGKTSELIYGSDLAVRLMVTALPEKSVFKEVKFDSSSSYVLVSNTVTTAIRYEFFNEDSLPRNFLLKAPLFEKEVSPTPVRTKADSGFYQIECGADASVELVITQKRTETRRIKLRTVRRPDIEAWGWDQANVDAQVSQRLEKLFEAQRESTLISNERTEVLRQVDEITKEQSRVTGLIQFLESDSPLMEKYISKLEESESKLDELRKKLAEVDQRAKAARVRVDELD